MKRFPSLLLMLATTIASVHAGNIEIGLGDAKHLPSCGGRVEATDSSQGKGEQLNLVFDKTDCDTFDILKANGDSAGYDKNKLPAVKGGYFGGSRTIPKRYIEEGRNTLVIVLRSSQSGKSDRITVRFRAETTSQPQPRNNNNNRSSNDGEPGTTSRMSIWLGQSKELASCGGTISITESDNNRGEQLNMVLRGVQHCTNFDILAANGDSVRQAEMKIKGGSERNRSGSFTLSKNMIDDGFNYVRIAVQSDSKATRDIVTIYFLAETHTPNVPSSPSDGGGSW